MKIDCYVNFKHCVSGRTHLLLVGEGLWQTLVMTFLGQTLVLSPSSSVTVLGHRAFGIRSVLDLHSLVAVQSKDWRIEKM